MPGCLHCHVDVDPAARPFSQRGVPVVVENELLDFRLSHSLLDLTVDHSLSDRRPVLLGEDEPVEVRNNCAFLFSRRISSRISRARLVRGETCSTPVFMRPPSGFMTPRGVSISSSVKRRRSPW